jgi:tetratricopeptide (TPR) repeat protein
MDPKAVQKYVHDRCKAAQTYLDHGLLTEGREIFCQIFRNLSYVKKSREDLSAELSEWFEEVETDLKEKLNSLDQHIGSFQNSRITSGNASEGEEDNSRTLYLKGIGLKELGFLDDAMGCLRKALEKGHPAYECLKELIDALRQKEDWFNLAGEIKTSFAQYEMTGEQLAELWRKLGTIYEKSHFDDLASEAFAKAEEYVPLPKSGEKKKPQAEPISHDGNQVDERFIEETATPTSSNSEVLKETAAAIEAGIVKELALESEPNSFSQPDSEPAEAKAMKEEISRLKAEIERFRELETEYQKRYQSIMSHSNALQKENKALKGKLERLGGVVSASDKK